jgi:cytochrome c556
MRGAAGPLLAIVGVALAACAPPAQIRYETRLEEVPAAATHAIHDERLEQLMRGLERLQGARLPQALDLAEQRERQVEELVEVAQAMAGSADRIRAVGASLGLDDADREAFLHLASQLEERSRELAREAPGQPPEALRSRVRAIEETCNGCHQRFRIDRESLR